MLATLSQRQESTKVRRIEFGQHRSAKTTGLLLLYRQHRRGRRRMLLNVEHGIVNFLNAPPHSEYAWFLRFFWLIELLSYPEPLTVLPVAGSLWLIAFHCPS